MNEKDTSVIQEFQRVLEALPGTLEKGQINKLLYSKYIHNLKFK